MARVTKGMAEWQNKWQEWQKEWQEKFRNRNGRKRKSHESFEFDSWLFENR
jgi:hypothetical protein